MTARATRPWAAWLLVASAAGCGGGDVFEQRQIGDSISTNGGIAGASLSDVWMRLDLVDGAGTSVVGVGHSTGGPFWQRVLVPQLASSTGPVSIDGSSGLWLAGASPAGTPDFVRVHASGQIDDFAADLPAGATTAAQSSVLAGGGGVFATVSVTSGATAAARLLRLVDGHLVDVPGLPGAIEGIVLAVTGPDEAYVWLDAKSTQTLVRYSAGSFNPIPWSGSSAPTSAAVSSPSDVWFYSGGFQAGATLLHGDGASFQPVTISGWPADGTSSVMVLALGQGKAEIVGWRPVNEPAKLPTSELVGMSLSPAGEISAPQAVGHCKDPMDCDVAYTSAARLEDGTLILVSQSRSTWLIGSAAAF